MSTPLLTGLTWLAIDWQIVLVGALTGVAAAIPGVFLLLRRMSMMGDALSHAVLPGLALAFLITGARDSFTMFVGAAVIGLLTAALVEWVHRRGQVDSGAAMGVVFTVLFAVGLVLLRFGADAVDLDPNCVLYGAIEYTPLHVVSLLGVELPRAVIPIGIVLLINVLCITLLFKEFKISAFDPALATSLGINAKVMHYLLMALVALTTVAAFESVGSILVIAMLIVPAATASLLTERLGRMLFWSVAVAILAAFGGHYLALVTPGWFGYPNVDTSTAGMMAVATGLLFVAALLFAPQKGLLSRAVHHLRLTQRIAGEDILLLLYRAAESPNTRSAEGVPVTQIARQLRGHSGHGEMVFQFARRGLQRSKKIECSDGACRLTSAGQTAATDLLRAHRLWEAYLDDHLAASTDQLHRDANRLEHLADRQLQERLLANFTGRE